MIKRFLTFCILSLFSFPLTAQNWADSLQAGIDNAFDLYDEEKDDEAISSLKILIGNAEKTLGNENLDVANAWHNLGVLYYRLFQYDNAIEAYSKALAVRKIKLERNDVELIKGHHNIGASYQYKGDFENAVKFLSEAISINGNPAVSEKRLIRSYREIARAYSKIGEHVKALGFYDSITAYYMESGDYRSLASTYNDMAGLFSRQDNGKKSGEMSEKALEYFDRIESKSDRDFRSLGGIYHNYAIGFEIKEDFESALNAYKKSIEINIEYAGEKSRLVARNHNNIGLVNLKLKRYKKALEHFDKAIALNFDNDDKAALADNHHNLGDLNYQQGNYSNALESYNRALFFLTGIENQKIDPPEFFAGGDKLGILTNLSSKAICEYQQYLTEKKPGDLDAALTTFRQTDNLVDQLRKDYRFDVSKSHLAERMLPVFEAAISACISKYHQTQFPANLEMAFRYAEKSKAVSLLEALTDSRAKTFAGLPTELRENERQLKVDIAFNEDELRIEKSFADADQVKIKTISNRILMLRQSYDELIVRIEKEFPDYHRLKYDLETRSVPQVQEKLLHAGQAMIEYFVGSDSLFVFYIRPKSFRVLTMEKPPFLEKLVEDFRNGISGFHLSANPTDIEYERLAKLYTLRANQLYQLLIGRLTDEGITFPKELVIIPDGVLSYLPFEALLTTTAKDPLAFSSLPYLINDHQVSYCYSATLLDEMVSKKLKTKSSGLLAMAPEFGHEDGLPTLENNMAEVEEIMTFWNGEKRIGREATKTAFLELAPGFRLLHLATHAKAEAEKSDLSFLAFSGEVSKPGNSRLLLKELYTLQLNADLVVLSACETGIGELRRGEGLISLARGMSYAGATGIVTTLWQIDDAKTSELMGNFYQNLKKGHSKSEALAEAKLNYISSNKHYDAHPFYWAAPVAIGDMNKIRIDLSPGVNWPWYLGVGVLLFASGFFIFRKRNPDLD